MAAGVDRLWDGRGGSCVRARAEHPIWHDGEEGEITAALRAVLGGLRLQVTWTSSLAKEVMPPAADTTAVFSPDVNGQADENEQDAFEGSWIELHELNGYDWQ